MKVLFAQEKPFLSAALQLTLASKGHSLIFPNDFLNVATAISTTSPDLLIADITESTGMEYIKAAAQKNIPVIAISENGKEEDLQLAFDLGAADYVLQPISFQELALRVSIVTKSQSKTN